jgi:nucleotide-binding universal stress UspA family protein
MLFTRAPSVEKTSQQAVPRYDTILVGTDFSPHAEIAVDTAVRLSAAFHSRRVHVAHVVPHPGEGVAFDLMGLPQTTAIVDTETRAGSPVEALGRIAREIGADLILLGSHGEGAVKRLFLGSVAQELVRVSPCPVLITPAITRAVRPFKNVVAGVDLSSISLSIVEHAVAAAKPFQGAVRAVTIFEEPDPFGANLAYAGLRTPPSTTRARRRSALLRLVARVPHDGVELTPHAVEDEEPWLALLEFAERERADLVVAGTSGHNKWERMMLGSTITKLLATAKCPVLVIPSDA